MSENENGNGHEKGEDAPESQAQSIDKVAAMLAEVGFRCFVGKEQTYLTLAETPRVAFGIALIGGVAVQIRAKEGTLSQEELPEGFELRPDATYAKARIAANPAKALYAAKCILASPLFADATYKLSL